MEVQLQEIISRLEAQKAWLEQKFGESDVRVKSLEEKINTYETRMAALEAMQKSRMAAVVPGLEYEAHKFSLCRAIWAIATKDFSNAGFEKEVFDATRKALSVGTDSAGGYVH